MERIEATDDDARVRAADLVIEAVFEDLGVKTRLWRELDGLAPAATIFVVRARVILKIRESARKVQPRR